MTVAVVSLLALLHLAQPVQGILALQGGTVTGVLRDAEGKPVPGVRMGAVARPDTLEDAVSGAVMAGLAETDEQGRYTLENVPPGRYYIAAGRLDLQTFFPGTQTMAEATAVTIVAGATLSGMDFVLNNTSLGRAPSGEFRGSITTSVPLMVKVENGGKLPVSANGSFTAVRLESAGLSLNKPMANGDFSIPGPLTTDFQVTVQNLPDTYVVKSITYGSTDITRGTFRLTPANFPAQSIQLSTAFFTALSNASAGGGSQFASAANTYSLARQPGSAVTQPSTLTITLGKDEAPDAGGVRVSGRTGSSTRRVIYISGTPGVFFSDGTFEFRGVKPGRHLIAAANSSNLPMAAVVVVGDRDVEGIELQETQLLPANILTPAEPLPTGEYKPGTIVPLAQVTGSVLEETTRTLIAEGTVIASSGDYSQSRAIGTNGRFEAFHLLPGTYDLKLQIFGHSTSSRTIVVDDKDMNLELTSLRLY